MTEKEMRCVKALRICHSNENCRDCEFMEADRDEKSCVNILFEESADLIESLSERLETAQPKWISVEDRLPDEFGQVLGVLDGMVTILFYSGDGKFRTGNGLVYKAESEYLTHWMPLPSTEGIK